jgi:signal transduction histidine kinase/DNA-binding response OmpR family regulator
MLHILIVDDNPNDRLIVARELSKAFGEVEVKVAIDSQTLTAALTESNLDLVITDHQLYWSNGLKVLELVRASYPHLPVIMFTDSGNEEIAVEGMKAGLSDYILKGKNAYRLSIAVKEGLEKQWLRQEYTKAFAAHQEAEIERARAIAKERLYLERLKKLAAASLTINSTLALDKVLQFVTEQACEIIEAHQAAIHVIVNSNDWASAITKVCLSDKYAQWRDYDEPSDGSGIYKLVCQMQRPMRLTQTELEAHPAWQRFGKAAQTHPPMRGWLCVPLVSRNGNNLGIIQLSDKYEDEFTEEDENIAVQLAQMATAAIDNASLYEHSLRLNHVKDEFLAIVSHELRTPLNAILGWLSILKKNLPNLGVNIVHRAIETIERNAQLQTQLVCDLLDISQIIQGKITLNVTQVNLTQSIAAAIETMQLAAQSKSIQIESYVDSTVGCFAGDAARLQQVVWNLLSNAIKFTPSGGRVEIRLEEIEEKPNTIAQITVSDTGKGINPEFIPYIFEYFRQADSSTTRKYGGLGLGLAIVRHLVELHGGLVVAESPGEGLGTTFRVKLPISNITELAVTNIDVVNEDCVKPLTGVRVLVVDDEPDNRDFLTFVLENSGAIAMSVPSASAALEALTTFQPDILISDIGMPKESGYSLLRTIRGMADDKIRNIPAIALTAYARLEDRNQALEAGFNEHLAKPIEPDRFIDMVVVVRGERQRGKGKGQ